MTKDELESKHLAELHALAAEGGVERYRMLSRAELIERLAAGETAGRGGADAAAASGSRGERGSAAEGSRERPRRRRRRSGGGGPEGAAGSGDAGSRDAGAETAPARRAEEDAGRAGAENDRGRGAAAPDVAAGEGAAGSGAEPAAGEGTRPRRRRRRRFGRRGKQAVTLPGLLLPPEAGRQAVLCAESRAACTALLRSVAAELAAASKGPDPVALLIDPSPEELADWKRDAPQAEIVAAGQPRHADDALAQAAARASGGEDVILLVDSLNRLGEAYGDADAAKDFFDAGRSKAASGSGTLTVVAALERPA